MVNVPEPASVMVWLPKKAPDSVTWPEPEMLMAWLPESKPPDKTTSPAPEILMIPLPPPIVLATVSVWPAGGANVMVPPLSQIAEPRLAVSPENEPAPTVNAPPDATMIAPP